MADMSAFWKAWAPYWRAIENRNLDVPTIRRLEPAITSPVLMIGAGQGLLVERLRKDGFRVDGIDAEPEMIAYAKKRRGLDLLEANARALPFPDDSYATVIVATGVIDFLDHDETIRSILDEAIRVARPSGEVFIAFYKMRERVEALLERLGMFTEGGHYYRMREIARAEFASPRLLVRIVRADRGILAALSAWLKMQFLSRKQRTILAAVAPEVVPYRRDDAIRRLFDALGVPVHRIHGFETCAVVQLAHRPRVADHRPAPELRSP